MASVAFTWLTYPGIQTKRGQAVYIVAVRDSHLFTMCPGAGEVKMASGQTWKSNNKAIVSAPANYQILHFLDDGLPGASVSLPLPAFSSPGAQSGGQDSLDKNALDRVAPDAEIERRIEREFLDLKEYPLVYSVEKADLVFLAEGIYSPEEIWSKGWGVGTNLYGDRKATFLQAALAIVVPADVYRRNPGDAAALLAARLWEGSVVWRRPRTETKSRAAPPTPADIRPQAASPATLVRQFLNKEKRPPSHFPLCAASGQPLLSPRARPEAGQNEQDSAQRRVISSVAPAQKSPPEGPMIKVDVALVTVPVIATDSGGKAVPNLLASDFHIFEDNVEQKIDRLITAGDPFDVALMLDTSGSMNLNVQDLQRSALAFVDTMRPEDRIMIISFNDRIYLHSESTADRSRLRPAILQVGKGQGTRLYDAIDLVMAGRLNDIPGRKAIVLFTDGVDTRSLLVNAARSLAGVQRSQILAYVVQFDTEQQSASRIAGFSAMQQRMGYQPVILPEEITDNGGLYARGAQYLQELSSSSGGMLYPVQTLDRLKESFEQIAWELGRQYTLCYYPPNPNRDGFYRRIRVTTNRQNVKLRFRTGYRIAR
jgi:VWFA-related protein